MKIRIESTQASFEKVDTLFRGGKLTQLLGFKVEDVQPIVRGAVAGDFDDTPLGTLVDKYRAGHSDVIVGNSAALKAVLELARCVARTDSTVLIQGEAGTGKELIARTIHNLSARSGGPFIRLNCAAIPFDLLESELFGHEKGAFTGTIPQKVGLLELADKGTLFLDEIGDIPPTLQLKLLRVLQEREFERLGSSRTRKVDVRLVAATHHDLAAMIMRNKFRSDLYYRLSVFPILVPPLRERREDIVPLMMHFVKAYARKMGKLIEHIAPETFTAFTSYPWPGNIRELRHLVERAVILSNDGILPNLVPQRPAQSETVSHLPPQTTLRDSERALIMRALAEAGWVVGGATGAATKLGLKRSTLFKKMKKLGISRPARKPDMNNRANVDSSEPDRSDPSLMRKLYPS